jgi:hypothetical protein
METLALATTSSAGGIPWLTPTIAVLTLLLGGGGIAALLKVRHDKRMGVAQQETAEDDALSNRWKSIIEAQTASLLEPMARRLVTLEEKVGTLESDLALSRRKYWSAISHIRTLYNWIARHLPEDIEQTQVPPPPATLAEDI